ncbi:uncharacterized protein MKS88_000078 [Plasmodium brasilianum]|uniref:uncharacterized protein n=1 Tax=Plasmodium brasilianum TaxID=5824 RepID=UPI00350E3FC2|nr:hypothetical protein MKS88_000078 [Plasmodium brasilianum]
MDKCLPTYSRVYGYTYFRYKGEPLFIKVVNTIKNSINDIIVKKDKEQLRNNCLYLASYLVNNKTPPPYYIREKEIWERTLNEWLHPHYKNLDELGGCPLIMDEKHLEILQLKYEVDDFCKKRTSYLRDLQQLKQKPDSYGSYTRKCDEYNTWIEERNKHFRTKKNLFESCYDRNQTEKDPKKICNIMETETFKKQPNCTPSHPVPSGQIPSKKTNKDPLEEENTYKGESRSQDQYKKALQVTEIQPESQLQLQHQPQLQTDLENKLNNELPIQSKTTLSSEDSPKENELCCDKGAESTKAEVLQASKGLVSQDAKSSPEPILHSRLDVSGENTDFQTVTLSSRRSKDATQFPDTHTPSKIPGLFKKKKKIKRRHMKFLKILIPSLSDKTDELLTHDHLENLKYDSEKTIKNILINEHNMSNKVHVSNRKKDRYKTIIEVHMEVLEEYRNTKWEYKKREFLEICLEMLAKEEYTVYTNLTNYELIIEDAKTVSYKEKQKIIWNKWIERHRNLAEKLKKVHWFNNLKNDCKRKLANIKKREELKNVPSYEFQNIPFSEREKHIWRQWIWEKFIIIKQYIEQDVFNYFTYELPITPDEYENKVINDSFPLINKVELSNKEYCQELYKYMKNKLLTKLCILALILVFEECKKEEYLDNRESYLDSSINEFNGEEKSNIKSEIMENISEFNRSFFENMENADYTTKDHLEEC